MATPDNGIAAAIYAACKAKIKVGNGKEIVLHEETNYPFEEGIKFTVSTDEKVDFPFYLRIPSWTEGAEVRVNGKKISVKPVSGKYLCIEREWADGDKVEMTLPMSLSMRTWQVNKNSVSVDYGPLTLSLKIDEKYIEKTVVKRLSVTPNGRKVLTRRSGLLLKSMLTVPGTIRWYWIRKSL